MDGKAADFFLQVDRHQVALGVHVLKLLPRRDTLGLEISQGPIGGIGKDADVSELARELLVASLHIGAGEVGAAALLDLEAEALGEPTRGGQPLLLAIPVDADVGQGEAQGFLH